MAQASGTDFGNCPLLPLRSSDVYEFDGDTAVAVVASSGSRSTWSTTVSDRWNIGERPNGGYALAIAARAIASALPDHPHPFSITGHFLRPSQPGPAIIEVEVVRTGRKLSTATATLTQDGKDRIRVLGTFGDLRESTGPGNANVSNRIDGQPPELPPIGECIDRGPMGVEGSTVGFRTTTMLHPGTGWTTGSPRGTATVAAFTSFADGRPADPLSLLFFADGLPPALFDSLPERVWLPTIELTVHVRAHPAPGPLRVVMKTRFLIDGYFEEDGEIWDTNDRLVAQSRQFGMVFRP